MDGGDWKATVHGVAELDTTEQLTFPLWPLASSSARGAGDVNLLGRGRGGDEQG